MSETDGRPRGRPPHRNTGKAALSKPGDEQPTYSHTQLIRFNNRFRARLLQAFRRGLESRESAASLCFPLAADNEPFHILTACRRAHRYRDLAGVTASTP